MHSDFVSFVKSCLCEILHLVVLILHLCRWDRTGGCRRRLVESVT